MEDIRLQSLEEFVRRTSRDEFQNVVQEERKNIHLKNNKWQRAHPEEMREINKAYARTENGQKSAKEGSKRRKERVNKAKEHLGDYDKHLIRRFYVNCPKGYVVDHIIPIAKGGKHELCNLQYLTPLENFKKGNKTMDEWKLYQKLIQEIDGK